MAFEFKLPDIGEGLTEGEVVKWLVKEGDAVEDDQPMVEVMTDKATVEITSPRKGTIKEIRAEEGETVPVGEVMVVIETEGGSAEPADEGGGEAKADAPEAEASAPEAPEPEAEADADQGRAPAAGQDEEEAPAASREPAPARGGAPAPAARLRDRTLAAPATRKRAREMGIDIDTVPGTGPNERVTREDLERFAASASASAPAGAPAAPARRAPVRPHVTEEDEHVPIRGMRARIAEQMVRSKQFAPHFTFVEECDVTELVALRRQAKPQAEERGVRLTYLPFIIKALVACLRRHPVVNAVVDDEKNEYVLRKEYNIGIATDTDDGLMVPVIKGADRLSVLEIAEELERLTEAARNRKIAVEDLKGSTITITSAGSIGGILATPILNYPEVAILGVYRFKEKPAVKDGEIVIRSMTNLSITLDHRIVDGATAARFMGDLVRLLETPGLLLLEGV